MLPGAVLSSNAASSRTSANATSESADAGFLDTSATNSTGVPVGGACEPLPPSHMDLTPASGDGAALVVGILPNGAGGGFRLHPTAPASTQPAATHFRHVRPSMANLGMCSRPIL